MNDGSLGHHMKMALYEKVQNYTEHFLSLHYAIKELNLTRVLATVNNSAVNVVFPILPMVELPNLFPKYLAEYQNVQIVKSKFKNEKSRKNKHKNNIVLMGKKKERHQNRHDFCYTTFKYLLIYFTHTCL